jgi:hypothetical protein
MTVKSNTNSLFILEDDKIQINPKILFIPEFSNLYNRDFSTNKKKSLKEFAYIYYMADYKSEYNSYGLYKEIQLGIDIFQNAKYEPDEHVRKAIDKYKLLQETPSMRYLISMRSRINKTISFLDNAEVDEKDGDKYKNPFITIDKITSIMSKLEPILETIEKWEKKVFEEEEEMKIRGGGVVNAFEDPESAKWIKK